MPSGVTLTDNANGTATLAGTPQASTGGSYTLTFTAANGTLPNATQSFTLTVDQAPAITSTGHTTFTVGQAGSFTVTTTGFPTAGITETGALPSGVTFADKGNGTAKLEGTPATGTQGTYPFTITAANGISPDATQNFTLTVQAATTTTTTTLSSALNPSKYGQSVMLTATVQATGGTIQPTSGTVQFWDGTALLGSAALANSNQASFSISALAVGSHSLRAVWLASANFQSSTSGSITQQVVKNQTVVQLGCAIVQPTVAPAVRSSVIAAAAAARIHRLVVFTILVHPAGAPAFLATEGTATIYQSNGRLVAKLPVRNGQVTFNRYLSQVWQKSYYAVYNGTRNLGRARSNMVRVTMSPVIAGAQSTPPSIVPKVTPAAPKATLSLAFHANRAAVLRKV